MQENVVDKRDRRDAEKYIRGFALKFPQVVVQSRIGEKVQTESGNGASSTDWVKLCDKGTTNIEAQCLGKFNVSIEDYPDVAEDTRKALNLNSGETVLNRLPLCVEISLRTTEGDSMVLEVWSFSLSPEKTDTTVRPSYTQYSRMGIVLKSLISLARVTPAYKLSRRQSADSYQILYRIYVGDPEVHCLGDGFKPLRVGQLSTCVGTVNMSVAYRTKMTISPTQTGRNDTAMMLKSDHFIKDRLSPKQTRGGYQNRKTCEKKVIDLSKPMKLGAFVDPNRPRTYSEDDYILPETPPFSWLLRKTKEELGQDANNNEEASEDNGKDKENQDTSAKAKEDRMKNEMNAKISSTKPSRWSISPTLDDQKMLKELQFPFATSNTPISDLAKFYRECTQAPPLQGMPDSPLDDEDSDLDDLTQKLEEFETAIPEFDSLVTSMYGQSCEDPFSH